MNTPFYRKRWAWFTAAAILLLVFPLGLWTAIESTAAWQLDSLRKKARANGEIADRESIVQTILKDSSRQQAMNSWENLLKPIDEHTSIAPQRKKFDLLQDPEKRKEMTEAEILAVIDPVSTEVEQAKLLLTQHPRSSFFYIDDIKNEENLFSIVIQKTANQVALGAFFAGQAEISMRKKETEKAVSFWKLNFLLRREIQQTPFLINHMIGDRAIVRHVFPAVAHWAKKGSLQEKHLREIQNLIPTGPCDKATKKFLETERTTTSEISVNDLKQIDPTISGFYLFPSNDRLWRFQTMSIYLEELQSSWNKSRTQSRKKIQKRIQATSAMDRVLVPSKIYFGSYSFEDDLISSLAGPEAEKRCFKLFLAAVRFQRKNSSFPASAKQLIPEFIDAVPVDPFSGRPIHYKKEGSGFVVWSNGSDESDDGGNVPKKFTLYNLDDESTDIGFRW